MGTLEPSGHTTGRLKHPNTNVAEEINLNITL